MTIANESSELLEIPLDAVVPAEDNPRTTMRHIDSLAASIRAIGVMQPLTVERNGDDTFHLIAGHRRLAAAQLAGLDTVPCIVRARFEDRDRVVAQVIENMQREPLDVLDEAAAYRRLVDEFGLSQTDVATRVGYSQAHVTKRLALLKLPDAAQEAIATGKLKRADAYELSRLADTPEVVVGLIDDGFLDEDDPNEREWLIDEAVRNAEAATAIAAKTAELQAAGETVVEPDASWQPIGNGWRQLDVSAAKHKKEPCHAFVVTWGHPEAGSRAVCTDPGRHTAKGDSKLKVKADPAATSGPNAEEKAKQRADREATKARKTFIRTWLAKPRPNRAEVLALVQRRYLADAAHVELGHMIDLLGLDVMFKTNSWDGKPSKDYRRTIDEFVARGENETLRACLAFALVQGEMTRYNPSRQAEHVTLLEQHGYEPTDGDVAALEAGECHRAVEEADEACERVLLRSRELNVDDPRIRTLRDELEDGPVGTERAREIQAELDGIFAELNDLRPGDVVTAADDAGHIIERAAGETGDVTLAEPNNVRPESWPANDEWPGYPPQTSASELACRRRIATLPADDPRVSALQQELLDGLKNFGRARAIARELKALAAEFAGAVRG